MGDPEWARAAYLHRATSPRPIPATAPSVYGMMQAVARRDAGRRRSSSAARRTASRATAVYDMAEAAAQFNYLISQRARLLRHDVPPAVAGPMRQPGAPYKLGAAPMGDAAARKRPASASTTTRSCARGSDLRPARPHRPRAGRASSRRRPPRGRQRVSGHGEIGAALVEDLARAPRSDRGGLTLWRTGATTHRCWSKRLERQLLTRRVNVLAAVLDL